ncbi:MAG: glycogen debranching protein GlgX [Ancrocorticia sp.]|uniref:glycogen debranching protein GlgX n=1 Tax=Ancrocorticia sp. TaxID=2593684 RepID=UPI003F8E75AC
MTDIEIDVLSGPRYSAEQPEPAGLPTQAPVRLGAHLVSGGADFLLLAPHASEVTLCLFFDDDDGLSEHRYSMNAAKVGYWSARIPGVEAGQRYGYRVAGRWAPELGLSHNPAKLLLDPYARAITQTPVLGPALYGHVVDEDLNPVTIPLEQDNRDSAESMALGVVVEESADATDHPHTAWEDTVIYETHLKGFTKMLPEVPAELRGTYAGMGHEATISQLKSLGITAVELLPIHASMPEPFLEKKGLTNYWGYNTLSFFAPEPSYATEEAQASGPAAVVDEVRQMVANLHAAGLEVILDVVYNHTCEGGADGPMVSLRGLDQSSYYLLEQDDPSQFFDTTGCGNSLDFRRQKVVRLTLDSLRYWVQKIGVDGFRFDLSVTLGRNGKHFDSHHPFFVALTTDPVLGSVKLINEPWDLGPNGWQTGRFMTPTADWNDHFRDTVRAFWVAQPRSLIGGGGGGDLRDLATRLSGSADLFGHGRIPGGRSPAASINFVTAHDGFTMRDLVSYNNKNNQANLESNRDGTNDNKSWDHGHAENSEDGPTPRFVLERRRQTLRNLMGTLILSAGTPMITAGDEFGRTQGGNNNSYCQDNEISWVDWNLEPWQEDLRETVSYLLKIRREHKVLRPTRFYIEGLSPDDQVGDLEWFDCEGNIMSEYRWFDTKHRVVQMLRSGHGTDGDALIVINGSWERSDVRLPNGRETSFEKIWDSSWPTPDCSHPTYIPNAMTALEPLSIQLYISEPGVVWP